MDPNRDNISKVINLPTPRLLNYYRRVSGQLSCLSDREWSCYDRYKEQIPVDKEVPRFIYRDGAGVGLNPVYEAFCVSNLVNAKAALKSELDKREHVHQKGK